ncbi:MAG: EthD family reductase [Myxococcales bacterium]|nr:EthD family reductase [Myxococcales bacterium]
MIKGFALIPQKAGITREKFHSHWFEIHAPLAKRIKALRRYVQSHRLTEPLPGFDEVPYEGIAEIWFDKLADVTELGDNPDYIDGALADEPNFIDQSRLRFLATREEVVIPGPTIRRDTPLVKAMFLLKRRADMSVEAFQKYWLEEHAPQIPRDMGVLRYVQAHQLPETYADEAPAFDGVAELSFENMKGFEDYWGSERVQAIFAADAPRFLGEGCVGLLVEEKRIIWPEGR